MHHAIFVALSTILLASHWPNAAAQETVSQERFSIRDEYPRTGSHIKDDIAISPLPPYKSYHELAPEQQEIVKARYEQMGEGDEPPYPEKGMAGIYKVLHEVQKRILKEGILDMEVEVDPEGNAQNVTVFRTPEALANEAIAMALMRTKYKPALCKGQPCSQKFLLHAMFTVGK